MDKLISNDVYAKEAEEAVLGGVLVFEDAFMEVAPLLEPEMFYDSRNRNIYATIVRLDIQNKPLDLVMVTEELKNSGKLEDSGNYAYISQLTNYSGDIGRIGYYARIIVQKYIQRELTRYAGRILSMSQDSTTDISDLIALADTGLDEIKGILAGNNPIVHVAQLIDQAIDETCQRERLRKEGKMFGISTGLTDLDRLIYGLLPDELIVLAGRPGSGKTAFLLSLAKTAALLNKTVCIYSLEMRGVSLADRLILSETNISPRAYRRGELSKSDYTQLSKAQTFYAKLPIYVNDKPGVSMHYVRNHSRIMHKKKRCDIVMIDYLQLMSSDTKNTFREQEVAQLSREGKLLAKELGIPVVLLAQLNRECEKREDKKPMLSDLRESGAIEQDADKVLFVYRPEYYGLKTMDGLPIKGVGKIIVAKHREGSVGEVKFAYNESVTKITDYTEGVLPF